MTTTIKLESIIVLLREEIIRAKIKHTDFPSIHHALSVIREEYLELEKVAFTDGISRIPHLRSQLNTEAIHLAATCIRLLLDEPEAT